MSFPRISYSLHLDRLDFMPVELKTLHSSPASSNPAFEFGTRGSFEFHRYSSAEELFENDMIFPSDVHTRERELSPQPLPLLSPLHPIPSSHGEATKQTAEDNTITGSNPKPVEKIQTKSFWSFRRSSSLSSESSRRVSFLFPLPSVMPRSNSMGSAAAPQSLRKRRQSLKQQQRPYVPRITKSSSSSSSSYGYACSDHISPFLRKSQSPGAHYGSSSIVVAPVLNVLPRCTLRGTTNFFGLGCLSMCRKEKKSRG